MIAIVSAFCITSCRSPRGIKSNGFSANVVSRAGGAARLTSSQHLMSPNCTSQTQTQPHLMTFLRIPSQSSIQLFPSPSPYSIYPRRGPANLLCARSPSPPPKALSTAARKKAPRRHAAIYCQDVLHIQEPRSVMHGSVLAKLPWLKG